MLSTQEDISAPASFVFARLTDYDSLERRALRRGAKVTRSGQIGVGTTWTAEFRLRGKDRKLKATLLEYVTDEKLSYEACIKGMEFSFSVKLVALTRSRTRMVVSTNAKATTLTARILLQSFKLAKQRAQKRFPNRVSDWAETIEDAYSGR